MALQLSPTVRSAMADAIESAIGASAILRIHSGTLPANCAASRTGTKLVEMALPSDYMANASAGVKALSGTWQDASADATGTAGYFSILDSTGTTCHMQGKVGATGDATADMTIDNVSIAAGQQVNVTAFGLTIPNA